MKKRGNKLSETQSAKVITSCNQKGGVGKTTTAWAMANILAEKGYRVLAVDTDPQADLSSLMDADMQKKGLYELLDGEGLEETIQKAGKVDLVHGSAYLPGIEQKHLNDPGRNYLVAEALGPAKESYDYIIIDTSPSLGLITVACMVASNGIIVPVQADALGVKSLYSLSQNVESVRRYSNPGLKINGILLTRHNDRLKLSKNVRDKLEEVSKDLGTKVYGSRIREGVSIREAQASQDIGPMRRSNVFKDYLRFTEEFLEDEK